MDSQATPGARRTIDTRSVLAPATPRWPAPVNRSGSGVAEETVALLFTDIEGSTALLERVGDDAWVAVLHRHHALVRGLVARHGGAVVHVLGDGFMIAFADVGAAIGCAVAIQRGLAASPDPVLGVSLRVRMGVHAGRVIRDVGDYHGRTVVVAARIAARARGREILVSADVAACDPRPAHVRFVLFGPVALKGLSRRETLYSVDWGDRPEPPARSDRGPVRQAPGRARRSPARAPRRRVAAVRTPRRRPRASARHAARCATR